MGLGSSNSGSDKRMIHVNAGAFMSNADGSLERPFQSFEPLKAFLEEPVSVEEVTTITSIRCTGIFKDPVKIVRPVSLSGPAIFSDLTLMSIGMIKVLAVENLQSGINTFIEGTMITGTATAFVFFSFFRNCLIQKLAIPGPFRLIGCENCTIWEEITVPPEGPGRSNISLKTCVHSGVTGDPDQIQITNSEDMSL